VRHGETEWSAAGRHTSVTDLDLTEPGVTAATDVGRRLAGAGPFVQVLTSPRLRARRTASLAGFPDAEVVEELAEWDYGDDEGLTTPQIREGRPGWTVWADGPEAASRRSRWALGPTRSSPGPGPQAGRCWRSRTGTSAGCWAPGGSGWPPQRAST
jgi:broad specificity phosphatase PhoE